MRSLLLLACLSDGSAFSFVSFSNIIFQSCVVLFSLPPWLYFSPPPPLYLSLPLRLLTSLSFFPSLPLSLFLSLSISPSFFLSLPLYLPPSLCLYVLFYPLSNLCFLQINVFLPLKVFSYPIVDHADLDLVSLGD